VTEEEEIEKAIDYSWETNGFSSKQEAVDYQKVHCAKWYVAHPNRSIWERTFLDEYFKDPKRYLKGLKG